VKTVAVIPARGGSKGIPRKNITPLCGKPLIVYSIEQALAAKYVDGVIVSTDDENIAAIAESAGATVFHRTYATATDEASSESALIEVSLAIPGIDTLVFLQATSPIRQSWDIDSAIALYQNGDWDCVFSARHVEGYTWRITDELVIADFHRRTRRQERHELQIEENGSIYVIRSKALQKTGSRFGVKHRHYLMHPLDSFQLDEPSDVAILELLIRVRLSDCPVAV
jgi:N-acylneuraminate cytidylyltransferase